MFTPQNPDGSAADVHPTIGGLSSRARHLAEVLSNVAFVDNARTIHVDVLARRMAVSARTVQRAARELAAAGVVAIDVGGLAHDDASTYRFPLSAPVEIVHRGDTHDTPSASTGVTPRVARGDTHDTHKIPQDPLVTDTYAVQRGGDSIGDGPEPWRAVMHAALAADDARRAAAGK
jgi:hypothetical protein